MSESSAVQRPMLKYAYQIGWEYLTSKEALQRREGKGEEKLKERYFADVLRSQLIKLNPGVVTSNNIDEILRRLRNIDNTIEGNREALNWLQGKQSIFVAQENRDRNITLIDFNNPENNIFQVTDEWSQKGVKFPNRADVIFLINGIPVAIAETKGEKKTDGLALGIDQIRRYHNQTPELLAFPQVFEVTELWNFWYGLTWNTNRKNLFEWKLTSPLTPPLQGEGNNNITPPSLAGKGAGGLGSIIQEGDYEEKIKTFFDHQRFLEILRYYIVFLERDDGLTKVILRQHQTRAVKKVLQRIQDPNKKRGLVWHTQGSGKTLTMITIAAQLRNISGDNTVIMIVDRNELENQLDKNLKAYSIKSYEVATSKADLEKLIQDDYRGLIVAMIHKFDKMKVENKRSTITVLVDEAHRSTGGNFGIYLMAALPNATFIGFTGTPVSKAAKGQNTFQTFGEPSDPKYSLDSYSTADSVRDGTTLKLNYALAKSEFRVPQEILEKEFLQLQAAEGINDIEELDGILDRAVKLKEFLKSEDRVDKVAKFVAEHFRDYVEPMGFKAFMVGVDREACRLYKQALDKYLPAEYSTVVYSRTTAAGLREYNLTDVQEKEVRKAFIKKSVVSARISLPDAVIEFIGLRPKDFNYTSKTLSFTGYCSAEDAQNLETLCGGDADAVTKIRQLYEDYRKALPKILIVTEKLLTGFDAPILYCMYLDKPMRDHVLLQGIARVNRPYEDAEGLVKPYGFVLDFIGIFGDKLEQALAFESGEVNDIIQNVDVIKNLLQTMMENTAPEYLPLAKGWDDKAKERAAAHFADKDLREKFFKFVRQLQSIYEILSPDPDLRPFMENYQAIVRLYGTIRAAYNTSPYIDIELTAKTKELVRRNITIGELEMPGTIHELNAQQLEQFRQNSTTDTVKVLNLSKALFRDVHEQSQRSPFLISIGERAETVRASFENRQIEAQEALAKLDEIANECIEAESERQRLKVDENTFAIYTVIKQAVALIDINQAETINAIYSNFPDYWWDARQEIDLRTELYATIYPITSSVDQTIEVTNNLLKLERVES